MNKQAVYNPYTDSVAYYCNSGTVNGLNETILCGNGMLNALNGTLKMAEDGNERFGLDFRKLAGFFFFFHFQT
jgi:hypothetical protein